MTQRPARSSVWTRSFVLAAAIGLSGCISFSGSGAKDVSSGSDRGESVWAERAAFGSGVEGDLSRSERNEMARALGEALGARTSEASASWIEDGAQGKARTGPAFLIGVESTLGGRLDAPIDLSTDYVLEPLNERVVTTANANVRLGPDTTYAKATMVSKGQRLTVYGKVQNADWVLVTATRGSRPRVLGYLYRPLLAAEEIETRGPLGEEELLGGQGLSLAGDDPFADDLALAGGMARAPILCRDFTQAYQGAVGAPVEWAGTACRVRAGLWRVVDDVVGLGS